MIRVTKNAEDVTHIPTAKLQNNDTASTTSIDIDSASDSSGEEETSERHSFSRKLAGEILEKKRKLKPKAKNAVHECIVLKYLAYKVRVSKNNVGGKKWFYATLEELMKVFPYIGKTTIYDVVIRLEKLGYLEISNFNKWHRDKTFWYYVPTAVCHAAESDVIYFDSLVAKETSVPAAVLLGNFEYWSKQGEGDETPVEVHMSPVALAQVLPFSVSTIKLGLATLEGKHIQKLSKTEPLYGLPEIADGPNPNSNGLNPNMNGSNPNSNGLNPNDITHCKPVNKRLETHSKPKPAASVSDDVSDDTKANDESIHSFADGIAPCADGQDRKEMRHDKVSDQGSNLSASQEPRQPRSFSPFDAAVPFRNAPNSDIHAPSTADSADEIGSVAGGWPKVDSLKELHQINGNNAKVVEELVSRHDTHQTFRQTIINVCAKTMGMIDLSIMDELYANPDGDEAIEALLPHFHQFLDQTQFDPSSRLTHIIYHAALECMVGAFLWPREKHDSYSHPIHSLISITRKLYLVLWRREENARLKAIEEERAEWCMEHASMDEHKENDASLSPAEKMRVFRNALNAKNKVGWIWFDQTHQTNRIQVSTLGLKRIEKLFDLNPDLTPADLLPIVDGCMNEYRGRPAPPKNFKRGVHWHARMGHRLHTFASYLETIAKQLGIKSPVEVYLSDAKLKEEEAVALAA